MSKQLKFSLKVISVIASIIIMVALSGKAYTYFLKMLYPINYSEYVNEMCETYNVDRELVYAVIKNESNFNSSAISHAGAMGVMQIMPDTFKWLQTHMVDEDMDESYLNDPKINIKYGTYLLSVLKKRYDEESSAICAYNAGIGTVDRWLSDPNISKDGKTLDYIPYKETNEYVKLVLKSKAMYKRLYFSE